MYNITWHGRSCLQSELFLSWGFTSGCNSRSFSTLINLLWFFYQLFVWSAYHNFPESKVKSSYCFVQPTVQIPTHIQFLIEKNAQWNDQKMPNNHKETSEWRQRDTNGRQIHTKQKQREDLLQEKRNNLKKTQNNYTKIRKLKTTGHTTNINLNISVLFWSSSIIVKQFLFGLSLKREIISRLSDNENNL